VRRALALPLAALLAAAAVRAAAEEIQRQLIHLRLGFSLKQVQQVYKPKQNWPSYVEPRGHVNRVRVERAYLEKPDPRIETMWLGFRRGSLCEIQLVYDAAYTRDKSPEELAADWSDIYGAPRRTDDGRYYWSDGSTVLHIFHAEVPVLLDKRQVTELRTSIQLIEVGLFNRRE
jgi:hypothetical protein